MKEADVYYGDDEQWKKVCEREDIDLIQNRISKYFLKIKIIQKMMMNKYFYGFVKTPIKFTNC
jgi:hypothetical protein